MAWVYNLFDSTTTLTLNGGSDYAMQPNGFRAPPPSRRQTYGGENYFRDGSDLMQRVFNNRAVSVDIWIKGTSQDDLVTNINAINNLLERGADYARTGQGSQLVLRRQWDNATNTSDFNILEGSLSIIGDAGDIHRFSPSDDYRIAGTINVTCEPFILGSAETIENYVDDPSFEVTDTDLADWTEAKTATGTTALDTNQKKFGLSSLKLTMTDSGGSGQVIERTQSLADVDASEVWSFAFWVYFSAASNSKVVLDVELTNASSATTLTVEKTSTNSGFELIKLENQTIAAGTTAGVFKCRLESTAADATGTAYIDGCIAVLAASIPDSWASSRNVANAYADDSQATTNYIDIHPIGGDVPALLQLRLTENESHTAVYAGARHGTRQYDTGLWIEGEGGTTSVVAARGAMSENTGTQAGMNTGSAALDSESSVTHVYLENTSGGSYTIPADTYFRTNFTIATPPDGQYRVLARVGYDTSASAVNADEIRYGLSFTYGGFTLLDDTNPSTANFAAMQTDSSADIGHLLDLGTITIPPVGIPVGATGASLILKVFYDMSAGNATAHGENVQWMVDALMLMPIDSGGMFVTKTHATDVILIDSRSKPQGAYILNTSDVVQSFPTNQLGSPPTVHPSGTRVYLTFTHGSNRTNIWTIAHGAKVTATVVPRYLYVR